MRYHNRPIISLYNLIITGFLILGFSSSVVAASARSQAGPIVVSIKPLYSLVAHLTEGIEQPVLLTDSAQSPHHFNLRPSQRRALSQAKIIIWVGPELEPYLEKIIAQQHPRSTIVSVMQSAGLKQLDLRSRHSHANNAHDEHDTTKSKHTIDPHIWLSVENAVAISKHIAGQLIASEPANEKLITNNLNTLLTKIQKTGEAINARLLNLKQPFIAHHDAFQYFEKENALNFIDAISSNEEAGSSMRHMREVIAHIKQDNIQCLVYQPPRPAIIDTLEQRTSIKAVGLDPLGLTVSDNKNAWFELMQQLASGFSQCLSSQ